MCMHARMRRLVWSGDGTYVRRRRPWPGARQSMRVRIPSMQYTQKTCNQNTSAMLSIVGERERTNLGSMRMRGF